MNFKIKINKQKRICDLILAVLLILIYFILGAIRVSPTKYMFHNKQREIDWAIFSSKKTKQVENKNQFKNDEDKKLKDLENENLLIPGLDFLNNESNSRLNLGRKKYAALRIPAIAKIDNKIDVASTEKFAQYTELNFSSRKMKFNNQFFPSNEYSQGPSIEIESTHYLNIDVYDNKRKVKDFKEIPDEKIIPEPEIIKIELRPEEVKEDERDISPFINDLIVWMRNNPYAFPDVVNRFMDYEEGNLTSKVKFKIDHKIYDLFLLCKENILEVRICLVEGDNAILLIDSGFKEKSNYLRKGSVKRDEYNSLTSFITRQEAPSEDKTKEFYQIFISWWDNIKSKAYNGDIKK